MDINERLARAERQIERQGSILQVLDRVLTHFVERDHKLMATIDTLTNSVNAFMTADAAVRASDQATIAADNQQIADLQAHVVPDELIEKLDAATATLNASLPASAPTSEAAANKTETGAENNSAENNSAENS